MSYNPNWQAPPPPSAGGFDSELGRKTLLWFKVYCGVLSLLYLFVIVMGIFLIVVGATVKTKDAEMMPLMGGIYTVIGIIFLIPFVIGLFLPKKPWAWVFGIVLIAIGFMGCPTVFASVALIIFWLKPETKALFGRS